MLHTEEKFSGGPEEKFMRLAFFATEFHSKDACKQAGTHMPPPQSGLPMNRPAITPGGNRLNGAHPGCVGSR